MRKCLTLILILLFLTLPVSAGEGNFSVVYIPPDDRPLNDWHMRLFAESLGVELIMPERSLYARNCTDDRGELLNWLMEQQGDYYIISLDQILSGGLIESRELTGETLWEEEVILRLKKFAEGKEVYFLDSLLRLACNVSSGADMEDYHATLSYGRGESAEDLPEAYFAVRQRKLRLNLFAAQNLPGYLLGVDDSWAGQTLQTGELEGLKPYVQEDRIFSTFDALPRVALAKIFLEETAVTPRVRVRYFGDVGVIPLHNFESAEQMTKKALCFFGTGEGNDLEILILTEQSWGKELLKTLRQNQKKEIPTILINLCPRDEKFEAGFLSLAPGQLLSYAGYGSSVNATHLGLSMGLARYAALMANVGVEDGHQLFFATLLADEFGYAPILEEVKARASALGLDIYDFRRGFSALETFTAEKMVKKTAPVFRALEKGGILSGVAPYTVSPAEKITVTGGYFPWHRCFEYHVLLSVS